MEGTKRITAREARELAIAYEKAQEDKLLREVNAFLDRFVYPAIEGAAIHGEREMHIRCQHQGNFMNKVIEILTSNEESEDAFKVSFDNRSSMLAIYW